MGSPDLLDGHRHPEPSFPDRLDTWKEVASHLRRSVRTVQRWEQEEALPVHRHHHDKQGSIYAYKHELDAWWVTRGAALETPAPSGALSTAARPAEPVAPPAAGRVFHGRRLAIGALALVVVAAAVAVVAVARAGDDTHPSHQRHRMLIATFDNHAGDATLGQRIRDALQVELGASGLADVVPEDQTSELLRLMRRPHDTPIDATIAREMSLRDGTVDAFITGAIDRSEAGYLVTVRVLTPAANTVAASFTAAGADSGRVLEALRQDVRRIRGALDERLAHNRGAPMPRVTTRSQRSLDLYHQAAVLMDQVPVKAGPALELLTEAVRLDPEFASAHILTAWALRNARRGKHEFQPPAQRAFELVDTTTPAERYFILGSYYQLHLEVEKAISAWEALLRLDPEHYWALGNLGRLYRAVGRHDAALQARARQVEIRPDQFWGAHRLAEALFLKGDVDAAREYASRAARLASQNDSAELQSRRSWFEILPACEAWLHDDVDGSLRIAHQLESTLHGRPNTDRNALAASLGYTYLTLGQRRAAERTFRRLPESEGQTYYLAAVASQYGDHDLARKHMEALDGSAHPAPFILGLPTLDPRALPLAESLAKQWRPRLDEPDATLLQGQLAVMRGRPTEARALLEKSIELREDRFGAPAMSASVAAARALRASGRIDEAIQVLEEASQNRFRSCLWPTAGAHLWIESRAALAQLYRQVGRDREALGLETQLRSLLRAADPDHPVVARLNTVPTLPDQRTSRD